MKLIEHLLRTITVGIAIASSVLYAQETICNPGEYQRTATCNIEYSCSTGERFTCPVGISYCCLWDPERRIRLARIERIVIRDLTCFTHTYGCGGLEVGGFFWTEVSRCIGDDLMNCWNEYSPCDDSSSVRTKIWIAQCQRIENREVMPGDFVDIITPCSWQNYCYVKYQPTMIFRPLHRKLSIANSSAVLTVLHNVRQQLRRFHRLARVGTSTGLQTALQHCAHHKGGCHENIQCIDSWDCFYFLDACAERAIRRVALRTDAYCHGTDRQRVQWPCIARIR